MKSLFSQKNQLENIKEEVFGNDRQFFLKIVNYKFLNHLFEYYKKDNGIKISKFSMLMQVLDPKIIMIITFIYGSITYYITSNNFNVNFGAGPNILIPIFMFLVSFFCIYSNIRFQIKNGIKTFILEDSYHKPKSIDSLLRYTKELIVNSEQEVILKSCNSNDSESLIKNKRL